MPVHFKEYPDIHLNRAPLNEVICQVRFPPILRIANEDPVDFQEAIRERFPKFEIEQPVIIGPLGQPSPQIELKPRLFRFKDRADNYSVTLAPDFFALVSKAYDSWTDFSDQLEHIFYHVQEAYRIQYAVRIGLRYVNVLNFENTGTSSFDNLISVVRADLVSLFRIGEIEAPYTVRQEIRTKIAEDGNFTLICALKENRQDEFILDFDRYIEGEIEIHDLLERCDRFHRSIYSAFRWSIAEGKLGIFDPVE
jgi:uncharacterized protein (TIGR04255 family)